MSAKSTLSIREATIKDLPSIRTMSYELFVDPTSVGDTLLDTAWPYDERGERYFRSWIDNPDDILLIAELGNEPVGFLSGGKIEYQDWRPAARNELYNLYTDPNYRSHGVGSALSKYFIDWSKRQGADLICVKAYADNERGLAFYKKMGFKPYSFELELQLNKPDNDNSIDDTVVA